jgi:hypothetical protein
MVADLKKIGVTDEQLQPLFGSAQAYINMWSAVFRAPAPDVSLSGVPATAPYGSSFKIITDNHGTTTSVPTITVDPSDVCSINGSVVTMNSGTGICSVTATWAPDGNYAKASITKKATATKIAPTVTFTGAPSTAPYAAQFRVSATTNASTIAVITARAGSACSISGTTVTMTSGIGQCSLQAAWAADNNYTSAQLTQMTTAMKFRPTVDLTVNGSKSATVLLDDTVTFVARIHAASPTAIWPNGSITISDSTNGAIRYGSSLITKDPHSNDGLATITNNRIAVGSYVLVATYGGDNEARYYVGAQSNTVSLQVKPKVGRTPEPRLAIRATTGAHNGTSLLVSLAVTNDGAAPAGEIILKQIALRSLTGEGEVTLLAPALPVMIGNLKPGASTALTLKLDVPTTVKKLRLSENGTFHDAEGKIIEFSLEQVLFPPGGQK